jgi:hypothetical protein
LPRRSFWPSQPPGANGAIILGCIAGVTVLHVNAPADHVSLPLQVGRTTSAVLLAVFLAILFGGAVRPNGPYDFALAAAAFLLLFMWQVSPWLAVVLSAIGGAAIEKI